MSGIFGIVHTEGRPVETEWLQSMQSSLAHRGPDGSGYWSSGYVGLGHLLLKVTPESSYEQSPYRYKHLVVTADARLDDRENLMSQLKISPSERDKIPDSLLIARAYEQFGRKCMDHLLGDFAFAIWDEQDNQLFCARDHAGVKPFFYYFSNKTFVFASDIKAIANLPFVDKTFHQEKLDDYFLGIFWGGEYVEETFFKNIRVLLHARTLTLEDQALNIRIYWIPEHRDTLRLPTEEDYAEALRHLLEQAVRDRLRTDYPVGVTLSGGLDSSSIACIAARMLSQQGRPLYAASSVLPENHTGPEWDERKYIEAVASQEKNLKVRFVDSRNLSFLNGLDELFDRTCQPLNSFHYMDEALDQTLAEKNGVRLVFSGFLGDMTASYLSLNVLAHLAGHLQFKAFFQLIRKRKQAIGQSYWNIAKQEILRYSLPESWWKSIRTIKGMPTPALIDRTPASPEVFPNREVRKKYRYYYRENSPAWNVYSQLWYTHAKIIDDEMSCRHAHHQLEYVYPMLDKRIIDFLFNIPPQHFLMGGWQRGLIRFAMKDVLPSEVAWRTNKAPFSPDFAHILRRDLPSIEKLLNEISLESREFRGIDLPKIKKIASRLREREISPNFTSELNNILATALSGVLFTKWVKFNYSFNNILN
jgi:asparagine synthase (glutamine-hydrolysing)